MISIIAVLITTISAQNYMYDVINLTMNDSEAYCASKYGTSLASIHNAEQNQEATSICSAQHICWIGLNDIDVEGQYVWTDGTKSDYGINVSMNESPWQNNEPNNKKDEDCVAIDTIGWNDVNCDEIYPDVILCNYPTIEPTNNPTNIINSTKEATTKSTDALDHTTPTLLINTINPTKEEITKSTDPLDHTTSTLLINTIHPTKEAIKSTDPLDHTTPTLLINTTAIITLPMHQTTISMHQTKAMTASPLTKTNNVMTVNLSDDNDDDDGDDDDDTLWKVLGVTASSVCIVWVFAVCIGAIIWFKSKKKQNVSDASNRSVINIVMNEEENSDVAELPRIATVDVQPGAMQIEENEERESASRSHESMYNMEGIVPEPRTVQSDAGRGTTEHKKRTKRGSAMNLEMIGSNDDGVKKDENYVNEEQKEEKNVDPNKIHQININDAVNNNNIDSDSDSSDTV